MKRLLPKLLPRLSLSNCQKLFSSESARSSNGDAQLTEIQRDYIDPVEMLGAIRGKGIDFFCGVPDSLLKDFCACVTSRLPRENHVIVANEGCAVSMAAGHYLASGRPGLVYLQNSGLGNTVNPIMSLASTNVYSIPMLLMIGWRGEPGKRDEPQHVHQGENTINLIESMHLPCQVLPDYFEGALQVLDNAISHMEINKGPFCLLVRKRTFSSYVMTKKDEMEAPLCRESAIQIVADNIDRSSCIVSNTGMTSRELFEHRATTGGEHFRDFLTVGCMGHSSSIAMGIATVQSKRQVVCLDGDGSLIMHMGALATAGQMQQKNFKHIVINNGAHDSVGGQPTAALDTNRIQLPALALASGYRQAWTCSTAEEIVEGVTRLQNGEGPLFMEILVHRGSRKDLGRPTRSPIENKEDLMNFLKT